MKKEPQNDWSGKSRGGASGYLIFVFIIRRAGLGAAYALLSLVALYFIPFRTPGNSVGVAIFKAHT